MSNGQSFNEAAKIYDDSRPSYPDEVINRIIDVTNPSQEECILEIGAGTGQATSKFIERGYKVHCIEPGHRLAEILLEKFKQNVTVDVISFENYDPQNFKTNMILSATAFHWLDKDIKYKKCFELLKDNGFLVLMWNIALDLDLASVRKSYELLWRHYPDKEMTPISIPSIHQKRLSEIEESKRFHVVDYFDHKWSMNQSIDQFLKGFFSQSSFLALQEEKRIKLQEDVERLYKSLKEPINTPFCTIVYIAQKC